MNWWKGLKGKTILNEPLAKYTSFKIGGRAKFFVQPYDASDLKLLINQSKRDNIPILVMGAGSNILVNDKGVKAIVVKLSSGEFKKISCKGSTIHAGSAVSLKQLTQAALKNGLAGIEFLSGIPGTVGGALVMNAGQAGLGICDYLARVRVMDYKGKIKQLPKKYLKFSYRKSNLDKYIILSASFKLEKQPKAQILDSIKNYLKYRRGTQNISLPNAGCIFKNPPGESAGKLMDLCGLKGKIAGGAGISDKHANFILNRQKARANDVLKLMALMQRKVKRKFNISLEPEIKIWQ